MFIADTTNLMKQLERITNINFEPAMIDWTTLDEEEDEDNWTRRILGRSEARQDEEDMFQFSLEERVAAQAARRDHITPRADHRIIAPRPAAAVSNDQVEEETGTCMGAAGAPVSPGAPVSRSSRSVRQDFASCVLAATVTIYDLAWSIN